MAADNSGELWEDSEIKQGIDSRVSDALSAIGELVVMHGIAAEDYHSDATIAVVGGLRAIREALDDVPRQIRARRQAQQDIDVTQ